MEKKVAGLLGAVAALGALNASQGTPMQASTPNEILKVNSFVELLEPIPNAAALLKIVDESAPAPSTEAHVQTAQFYHHHHHHHHHHHSFYPRYGYGGVVVVPGYRRYYRHHHHHHHHHHHSFYRRDW